MYILGNVASHTVLQHLSVQKNIDKINLAVWMKSAIDLLAW